MAIKPGPETQPAEGLRERKRRETQARIADAGMRLFLRDGFEGTTLDAIAAEAGISRRAFFSHFKSKEDLVMHWQAASWAALRAEVLKASPEALPLQALQAVLVRQAEAFSSEALLPIDRLMRSSPALMTRKQAFYVEQEAALFEVLTQVWRQPERQGGLRVLAMVCIGLMRLSIQNWHEQGPEGPSPAEHLNDAFARLRALL